METREGVRYIRVNRPRFRNALSRETLQELGGAFADVEAERHLKAVVLTGEGEDAFASGGDLKELASARSLEEAGHLWDTGCAALDDIRNCSVTVVAALNGLALGGGAELALACDFRIAATHVRFGYVHAGMNICCGFGGGSDLIRVAGERTALLHALRAEALGVDEAVAAGLVDAVAAQDESLESCVERFLAPIRDKPAQVIRAYKAMVIAARRGLSFDARRTLERQAFCNTWVHADHWHAFDRWQRAQELKASSK